VKTDSLERAVRSELKYGRLAELIRIVLDESAIGGQQGAELGATSRACWASILGVSRAALSQWVTGKTIPSPEHFLTMLDVLEGLDDSPGRDNRRALDYLRSHVDEPMSLLVFGSRSGLDREPSRRPHVGRLGDYILGPTKESLCLRMSSVLVEMTFVEQLNCVAQVRELLSDLEDKAAVGRRHRSNSSALPAHIAKPSRGESTRRHRTKRAGSTRTSSASNTPAKRVAAKA